jgi:hypothetical protein
MLQFQKLAMNLFLNLNEHILHRQQRQLRDRKSNALQTITADMRHIAWDKFDYRVDVCRVTHGTYIAGF